MNLFFFFVRFHFLVQMDEMLMAKEAEKAELMKQRQKLRGKLEETGLAGDELDRVR